MIVVFSNNTTKIITAFRTIYCNPDGYTTIDGATAIIANDTTEAGATLISIGCD